MRRWIIWTSAALLLLIGGVLGLAWTPDRDPSALRAKYMDRQSRLVDLGGGLRVHVRDAGPHDAPVLVLVHGSNASLHTWRPWAERLAGRYRIVAYDQPGHGLTGPHPRADYRAEAYVDVAERVARALDLRRFVLVGNSMGGWLAWNYAIAHPERLRGLVLVDASGVPAARPTKLPIGFRLARSHAGPLLRHLTPRWLIASSVEQSLFVRSAVTPAMIDRYWELLLYPGNRQATLDRSITPRSEASDESMARITAPTLVMWGAEDTLIPRASADWFARRIPAATLAVLPGVGHIPMEEAPDQSVRVLSAWLERLPA